MYEIPHLLAEYDRAGAYTDELWRDLTAEELHWRPEQDFSPIGWHLGHQAHVAHFMIRNLTAAEPSPAPDLDDLMDSANFESTSMPHMRDLIDQIIRQEVLVADSPMPADTEVARPAPYRAMARIPQQTAAGHTLEADLMEFLR
ncbi:DinB family protein [Streptosporangium canum]|uniref:DinB family protein n=1 Tax=Streptosporangium canum TaxID=324952 RepID=UPI003441FE79